MMATVQVNGLTKRFGRRLVLDDIHYAFDRGVYGLLGPNGAGKTTLIRCLTRHYREGRRAILYRGEPIGSLPRYYDQLGYLPQRFGLFPELTVRDMLLFLANLKGLERRRAAAPRPGQGLRAARGIRRHAAWALPRPAPL